MSAKSKLHLNNYEWWRNHRRLISFGGFLMLFGWWMNPVVQEAKQKVICAKWYSEEITNNQANRHLGLKNNKVLIKTYCSVITGIKSS